MSNSILSKGFYFALTAYTAGKSASAFTKTIGDRSGASGTENKSSQGGGSHGCKYAGKSTCPNDKQCDSELAYAILCAVSALLFIACLFINGEDDCKKLASAAFIIYLAAESQRSIVTYVEADKNNNCNSTKQEQDGAISTGVLSGIAALIIAICCIDKDNIINKGFQDFAGNLRGRMQPLANQFS